MEVKTVSLDDLLSTEDLAKVTAKRKAKGSSDLSDLIPKRPPEIEVLAAVQVIYKDQLNVCMNCKTEVRFPLGLVAMHQIKRHGRKTSELIGIALTSGNQHPQLERIHETTRSTSIVCSACVDTARFVEAPRFDPPVPVPGTAYWAEQFGWGNSSEIHQREASWRLSQERLARELEEPETHALPTGIEIQANELSNSEAVEITLPEDTQ